MTFKTQLRTQVFAFRTFWSSIRKSFLFFEYK